MAERNKVLSKDYADDFSNVTIKFLESGEVLTVNISALSAEVRAQAICHGLIQKLGDAAAGETGDEAYNSVMGVYERIAAGEWAKVREKGEVRPTIVAEAVIRAAQADGHVIDDAKRAAVVAKYTGKDAAPARKAALSNVKVAAAAEAIRRELADARLAKRAAETPAGDTSALL